VRGEGRGATVLKEKSVPGRSGRFVNGAGVYGTLAMVGVTNASVQSLTIDHRESTNSMNGIVLMPEGTDLTGKVSAGCTVEDCAVLGHADHRTYLIWSMRAQQIHILNNFCDGGTMSYTEGVAGQEGIEVFGGQEIWILGNVVERISDRGINIGNSEGNDQVDGAGVWVSENYVSDCKIGAYVNASYDPEHNVQNTSNVGFLNNRLENLWLFGLEGYLAENTTMKGVIMSGNSISNVVGPGCAGIELFGYGKFQGSPIHVEDMTVDHM
jgi:hypothetical protein